MRFSIRRLMIGIAIVAVALAIYRVTLFDTRRCNMAIGVFGPLFEHNGTVYDREVMHSQIATALPDLNYQGIDSPAWADDVAISGSDAWAPSRSDWFVIERSDTRIYLHLASAHDGLAIDVWINEGLMLHQLDDPDQILTKELRVSNDLVSELQSEWIRWCNAYRDNPTNTGD